MLRSVAPSLLTWLALISVLIVVVEATGPLPGLRWDRLQVWEGSAAHDAWSRVDEYTSMSPSAPTHSAGCGCTLCAGLANCLGPASAFCLAAPATAGSATLKISPK